MPATTFPVFPDDVSTHALPIIDFSLIKLGDKQEIDRLWDAGTSLGFWYLKNHGAGDEVNGMFDMGAETMALPLEEKLKFAQMDDGLSVSFGYKAAGSSAVNAYGDKDGVEFLNISKDDAIAWPNQVHRSYPPTAAVRMETTVKPFVRKSLEVTNTILEVFNNKLGLPAGRLLEKHPIQEPSGSETRLILAAGGQNPTKEMVGSHTDFGSLSFLHNRLGGLQLYIPGPDPWKFVKPIPGHAICNVGDALSIFSGGILTSGMHRVLPPPGSQHNHERWSLVFFSRPGNSIILQALKDESPLIADAVAKAPNPKIFEPGETAYEWFIRRVKTRRLKNRKGPETWLSGLGTEVIKV